MQCRLDSLTKLKELRLSDNRVEDLGTDLQRLSELHTLALDGNLLKQAEVQRARAPVVCACRV